MMSSVFKYIILGIDLFFLVGLVISILWGFLKGWKKSLVAIVSFLIPFIIFSFFLTPIAKAILEISFGDAGTLNQMLTNAIAEMLYEGNEVQVANSQIYAFAQSIAVGIVQLAVYLVGALVIAIIICPIVKIILRCTLPKFIFEKPNMLGRLIGLGTGFVRFCIFFIIFAFPIFGVISAGKLALEDAKIVMDMTSTDSNVERVSNDSEESELDAIYDLLDSSWTVKILDVSKNRETGINLSSSYLGFICQVKSENVTFNILKEYGNIRRLLPIAQSIVETDEDNQIVFSVDKLNDEQIDILTEVLKECKLVKAAIPIIKEVTIGILENMEDADKYQAEIEAFKNIDLNEELGVIINVIAASAKSLKGMEINFNDPLEMLADPSIPANASNVINELLKSKIIVDILIPRLSLELAKALKDMEIDEESVDKLVTSDTIKNALTNDVKPILEMFQQLYVVGLKNVINNEGQFDLGDVDTQNAIGNVVGGVFNLSIIKGNEEDLLKIGFGIANVKNLEYDQIFEGTNIDWANETAKIVEIAKAVLELIGPSIAQEKEIGIDLFLETNKEGEFIAKDAIIKIAGSDLIRVIAIGFLESILESEESNDIPAELRECIDCNALRSFTSEEFQTDILSALDVVKLLKDANVIFANEGETMDLTLPATQNAIASAVEAAFNLKLISGKEEALLKYAFSIMNIEGLSFDEIFQDIEINWTIEKAKIVSIIKEALKLIGNSGTTDFNLDTFIAINEEGEFKAEALIVAISGSDLIRKVALNYLEKTIGEYNGTDVPQELINCLNFNTLKNLTSAEFQNEVLNILDILKTLVDMKAILAAEGEEIILTEATIEKLVLGIFKSVLIKNNEQVIVDFILEKTSLKDTLEANEIAINFENVNWETEPQKLVNVMKALLNFGDLTTLDIETLMSDRSSTTQIVALFDALTASDVFRPTVYSLIEKMVLETGYEVTITDLDKAAIATNGWGVEFNALYDILDEAKTVFDAEGGYDDVTGAQVSSIMKTAANSVIATKIIGTFLNTLLGPDNLNINPVNPDGTPKYNFMDPAVLSDSADSIGALIDLNTMMSNFDNTAATATQDVGEIVDTIASLSESEMVNDIIADVIGDTTLPDGTEINFANEAQAVQNVYNEYENDPENFDIANHPELEEQLANSELAESILKKLGILP